MEVTDDRSARLIRLPLWMGMDPAAPDRVAETLASAVAAHA
jgi:dTDP-4-amino-4,6-dideoxygalactose transaminase